MLLRVPPWMLNEYPFLNDVLSILVVIKELWHQYQGIVLVVALWLIHRQLRRERILFGEKVGNLSQIVKGIRDDAEAGLSSQQQAVASAPVLPQRQSASEANHWEDIRIVWRELRDRLELAIEQIQRRATRAKYAEIPRYGYRRIIKALEDDGEIGTTVSTKLLTLDNLFARLKFTPASASADDAKHFRETRDFVDHWLPKAQPADKAPPLGSPPTALRGETTSVQATTAAS